LARKTNVGVKKLIRKIAKLSLRPKCCNYLSVSRHFSTLSTEFQAKEQRVAMFPSIGNPRITSGIREKPITTIGTFGGAISHLDCF
jgi:hypothetical protein